MGELISFSPEIVVAIVDSAVGSGIDWHAAVEAGLELGPVGGVAVTDKGLCEECFLSANDDSVCVVAVNEGGVDVVVVVASAVSDFEVAGTDVISVGETENSHC